MQYRIKELFASDLGRTLYKKAIDSIIRYGMKEKIESGVAVGFSGGADSVFLLSFLVEYRMHSSNFPIVAFHVNHSIRGAEADADEAFCKSFADRIGVEFFSVRRNVPAVAERYGLGIEEAARKERYSAFSELILGRNDIGTIALAHNSSDNAETVLLNLVRGSGIVGMCGIPPVRDCYIRPIIAISQAEIRRALEMFNIEYVIDSTNLSDEYSRNFLRHNVVPLLSKLNPSVEDSVLRMTDNLRQCNAFLAVEVDNIISKIGSVTHFSASFLRNIPSAVFAAAFSEIVRRATGVCPSEVQINAVSSLINENFFSYSLTGEYDFVCQRGECIFLSKSRRKKKDERIYQLKPGENILEGYDGRLVIGDVIDKSFSNIYNSAIQVTLPGAIIDSGLYIRFRRDGDGYCYGGINRKLKKIFNDHKIPEYKRGSIPILCDSKGILWVPGLPCRDGLNYKGGSVRVTLLFNSANGGEALYSAENASKTRKINQKGTENT